MTGDGSVLIHPLSDIFITQAAQEAVYGRLPSP